MFRCFGGLVCATFLIGCSGGSSTPKPAQPVYDPAEVGKAAITEFDKNKNGSIEGAELDACPSLRYALAAIDLNGDQKLSAAEIEKRVAKYPPRDVSVTFKVTLDGQALGGALLTLEREKFMGGNLKTATATTDKEGLASADLPAGFYRIRVTKDDAKLPARYNTQTVLGRELIIEPRQAETMVDLALTR